MSSKLNQSSWCIYPLIQLTWFYPCVRLSALKNKTCLLSVQYYNAQVIPTSSLVTLWMNQTTSVLRRIEDIKIQASFLQLKRACWIAILNILPINYKNSCSVSKKIKDEISHAQVVCVIG